MDSDTTAFHRLRLLLLLATLAGATGQPTTSAIRGTALVPNKESQAQAQAQLPVLHQRNLLQESTCTLFRKCVTFGPSEAHPKGHHEESWVCQLSNEDSERMNGVQFVDLVESKAIAGVVANATSGASTLSVSNAIVDAEEPRMFVPETAHVRVFDTRNGSVRIGSRNQEKNRDLSSSGSGGNGNGKGPNTKGTLNTLVIRVIDSNGVEPTANTGKMVNDVFEDSVSLKTQTEACSYDKLRIEPFRGNTPGGKFIDNGVVDVQMDYDIKSNAKGMDQAALKAAKEVIGDLDDPMFDLLLICFPPGKDDFIAYAYPNSKYSFYNDEWCGFVGAQMHEVGHNLGLAHSGEPVTHSEGVKYDEYGDGTGYMGGSGGEDDWSKCFNPQKNYQLGWYEDQVASINPLDGKGRRAFILNGVSDYGRNKANLVVLRLLTSDKRDFYIGYNRATGINRNTDEDINYVTVIRKEYGGPHEYGQSTKVKALSPGQGALLEDFNGSGKFVQIAFTGITGDGDALIMVQEGNEFPFGEESKHCQNFFIEVVTDDYPEDNSWYVADKEDWGRVVAASPTFDEKNKEYRRKVCIPQGRKDKTYKFFFEDRHGDGIYGDGYRVLDMNEKILFSGGKDFAKDKRWNYHEVMVSGNPNVQPTAPPTQYPTQAPTPTPPCREYTVEVKTDGYPEDTRWNFVRENSLGDKVVDEQSPVYNERFKIHSNEVCLHEGYDYTFKFEDSYEDGLLEGSYYKLKENCSGKVLVDSGTKGEEFKEKIHTITVPTNGCMDDPLKPSPTAAPTSTPTAPPKPSPTAKPTKKPKCKNTGKKKFSLTKNSKKKKKCKQWAKKKQCNKRIDGTKHDGKLVSDICQKSCKVCSK